MVTTRTAVVAMKVVQKQNDPEGRFFEQIESEYQEAVERANQQIERDSGGRQ